jgi:hypothetical protein
VRRIVAYTSADAKAAISEGERLAAEVAAAGLMADGAPEFERRVNELKGQVGARFGGRRRRVGDARARSRLGDACCWCAFPSVTTRACACARAHGTLRALPSVPTPTRAGPRALDDRRRRPPPNPLAPTPPHPPTHPPTNTHTHRTHTLSLFLSPPPQPTKVDTAVIPAAAKAAIREDIAALARRVLDAQRAAAAAAKELATGEALAAADEAAGRGAHYVVKRIDVGADPKVGARWLVCLLFGVCVCCVGVRACVRLCVCVCVRVCVCMCWCACVRE